MDKSTDGKFTNIVLSIINLKPTDKIIAVRENSLADANFVLTHIMKNIFQVEANKLCLIILHNTIGHYQNVGKKLGFDFLRKMQDGCAVTIEPLKIMVDDIDQGGSYLSVNKEDIVKKLFSDITNNLNKMLEGDGGGKIYLVIDDLSHLLDLGVEIQDMLVFINYCVNLASNDRVSVIFGTHISNKTDEVVGNAICHVSDLVIDVSTLKTGISHNVTGVISLHRSEGDKEHFAKQNVYHYKAYDREIRTFAPGESLYFLYQ